MWGGEVRLAISGAAFSMALAAATWRGETFISLAACSREGVQICTSSLCWFEPRGRFAIFAATIARCDASMWRRLRFAPMM